jgi:hypothetical protein
VDWNLVAPGGMRADPRLLGVAQVEIHGNRSMTKAFDHELTVSRSSVSLGDVVLRFNADRRDGVISYG